MKIPFETGFVKNRIFDFGDTYSIYSVDLTSVSHHIAQQHNMARVDSHTMLLCY